MSTFLHPATGHERGALEASLTAWWCTVLELPSVGVHADFFQSGGNPERAAAVVSRIRQELKISIQPSDLYEARTISKLADQIELKQSSREEQCVVAIRSIEQAQSHAQGQAATEAKRRPLFLVHGVGGNILGFAHLARSLSPEQPVYGIQAQALNSHGPTLIRLEAMAAFYIEQLRQVQPEGPYAFLGFSFGGLVTYEMARQLTAAGESISLLGMLDTWQPGYLKKAKSQEPRARRSLHRLKLIRLNTRKLSPIQLVPYAFTRIKSRALRVAYGRLGSTTSVNLPDSMRRVRDINMTAAERYTVRPYLGEVTMFRAEDAAGLDLPEDLGWRAHAQSVKVVHLPGDHGQILAEPNLSFMTAQLEAFLNGLEPTGHGLGTSLPACQGPGWSESGAAPNSAKLEEFELDDDGLVALEVGLSSSDSLFQPAPVLIHRNVQEARE